LFRDLIENSRPQMARASQETCGAVGEILAAVDAPSSLKQNIIEAAGRIGAKPLVDPMTGNQVQIRNKCTSDL
jgi:hypothetical protein